MNKKDRWYVSAVKSALILNYGIDENDAIAAMQTYRLEQRMELDSSIAKHYEPESTADDIIRVLKM